MNASPLRKAMLGVLLVASLAACSTANTQSDEVFVHKGAGIFEGHTDKGCVNAATKEYFWWQGAGDDFYAYPANQRTYNFTGGKDSDRGPIDVVSSDGQTLSVPGTLSFNLNTDCKVLQSFHDNVGNRYTAYFAKNDDVTAKDKKGDALPRGTSPDQWSTVLNLYMYPSLNSTLDRVAKRYTWKQLYSDLSIKDEMNAEINKEISRLVNERFTGDYDYFSNFSAQVLQPNADPQLVKTVTDTELAKANAIRVEEQAKADAKATTAKAQADAQAAKLSAEAQVAQKSAELRVAKLEAQIKAAEIASYGGPQKYNDYLAIQKGLNPYQPTYGGQTLVQP